MFRGWLRFGGDEVFNTQRLAAYARNGYVPAGVEVKDCDDCDTLDALNGEDKYESPLVDGAPWFDPNNEDTWDFAGILPLDIVGLTGSTRTAEVRPVLANGGSPTRQRFGPRTIAVSALLLGRTTASAQAGMEWLTSVLNADTCTDTGQFGCGGHQLCALTDCPTLCDFSTDPEAPLQTFEIDPFETGDGGWLTVGGSWIPSSETFEPSTDPGLLAAPILTPYDEVVMTWTVTSVSGPFTVEVGAVGPDGTEELLRGDPVAVPFTDTIEVTIAPVTWEQWRPAIWISEPGAQVQLTIQHRPYLSTDACVDHYLRNFEGVITVAGPTETGRISLDCGVEAMQVEWTWVAASPWVTQTPKLLVQRMPSHTNAPEAKAIGVTTGTAGLPTLEETRCLVTAVTGQPCQDPCCSSVRVPPRAPAITEECLSGMAVSGTFARTFANIPARYVPVNTEGTLRIQIEAPTRPKMGVRFRLYPDPLERGFEGGIDECDFCAEWNIGYIPHRSTFVLDGGREGVNITCPPLNQPAPTSTLRGRLWSPAFEWPVLACGLGYVLVMDVPTTYYRDCPGGPYTQGATQGTDLRWTVHVVPRMK